MADQDIKILNSEWTPTAETLALLKLNNMTDEHVKASLAYLKKEYPNTNIDDVPNYDTWSSLFVMFCIKASRT